MLEHRFRYDVPMPPLATVTAGPGGEERVKMLARLQTRTIAQWRAERVTVRLHAVESNDNGDVFLLLSGAPPSPVLQVADDRGTLYIPAYYIIFPPAIGSRVTVHYYVPLVRSPRPGRRVLSIALPGGPPAYP